jgi:predicted pyridoxine 5'-phosphate oxidase superfamily flavin-nucleotide-binding protein
MKAAAGSRRLRLEETEMGHAFLDIASTPSVRAAQGANGGGHWLELSGGGRSFDRFTEAEVEYIQRRDSFYMATVSEEGWPYVQHRGGPPGFLKVLDDKTLGFADFRGNRQYISVGNVGANDRAALILIDYPNRRRLKIYAHVELKSLDDAYLADRLALTGYKARAERGILLHLEAFDWNCPQHITPRYTEAELAEALAPVRQRISDLEEEVRTLRSNRSAG